MKKIVLLVCIVISACSGTDNSAVNNSTNDSMDVSVWLDSSVQANLYLPSYGELVSDISESPAALGIIHRSSATAEQLTALQALKVDRPFEYSRAICDTPAGYDIFYLVITDQDGSTRRFAQYSICRFLQGDGFFQAEADGFLDQKQICDLGTSFGVVGFQCREN